MTQAVLRTGCAWRTAGPPGPAQPARRGRVAARVSELVCLTRRDCLSALSEANAASLAAGHASVQRREVGATRRPRRRSAVDRPGAPLPIGLPDTSLPLGLPVTPLPLGLPGTPLPLGPTDALLLLGPSQRGPRYSETDSPTMLEASRAGTGTQRTCIEPPEMSASTRIANLTPARRCARGTCRRRPARRRMPRRRASGAAARARCAAPCRRRDATRACAACCRS